MTLRARQGWHLWGPATPKPGAVYHVYPVNDLRPHVLVGGTCWCNPILTKRERGTQVVHNAADGRELVEQHGLQ